MFLNQNINNEKDSKNIILWYPFKEGSNILEFGANNLEITKSLLDKGALVTSVVFNREIEKEYLAKFENKNLTVILSSNDLIKFDKKYDYIVLIDVIKYLKEIFKNSNNPILDMLNFCKNNISENGKILLAVDNRFGIRNFSGNCSKNEERVFQILEEKNENYKLYTKLELINIIKLLGLNFKFYYPYPNLENANVIFSENYLPKGNNSKINYNVIYESKSKVILDEINLIKQFSKNNIADIFSNSFFIEIFKENNNQLKNDIEYIGFNNLRKDKYKTVLIINDGFVIKTSYNEESISHIKSLIENVKRLKKLNLNVLEEINDEKSVKLKYISNDKLLDNVLCEALERNDINRFYTLIDLWKKECLNKLEEDNSHNNRILDLEISEEISKELTFLKDGFIDLVFENIFFENNQFIIYDQEWNFENIPLEYIMYRGITNLYTHNNYLNKLLKYEDVLKYYKLDKYKEIFNKVEDSIQRIIVDEKARIKYVESNNRKINIEDIYQKSIERIELINQINFIKNENENLKNENKNLKNENINLENATNELNKNLIILQNYQKNVENSRGWKLIKKIKKILNR